jgi:hypothetical protein
MAPKRKRKKPERKKKAAVKRKAKKRSPRPADAMGDRTMVVPRREVLTDIEEHGVLARLTEFFK